MGNDTTVQSGPVYVIRTQGLLLKEVLTSLEALSEKIRDLLLSGSEQTFKVELEPHGNKSYWTIQVPDPIKTIVYLRGAVDPRAMPFIANGCETEPETKKPLENEES
jgi:hypothetical protein